jgi:hypothetical protein
MALFSLEGNPEDAPLYHYNEAIRLLNETPRIHQEVTFYAWPLTRLVSAFQEGIRIPLVSSEYSGATVVIFGLERGSSGLTGLKSFQGLRIILDADEREFVGPALVESFGSVQFFHSNGSTCSVQLAIVSQLPASQYPLVFVDLREGFSESLLRQYLGFIQFRRGSRIPDFLSFGQRRGLPRGDLRGAYDSHSFAISGKQISMARIQLFSEICESSISSGYWQNAFLSTKYAHLPLRCDDESLPISLRLCAGDEHVRTDWRDTTLAPVVPRHPVI